MSQYSHLTVDLTNENSAATKIAQLVGRDRLVLDVGCAHGYLAEVLRTRGCRVVGVEIDAEDANRARQHCEQVLVRDVEEPGWVEELGGRRFDVVVFSDVLEHLRDPGRVLRDTLPLLEPRAGFVVASVPNVAHVSVRLELLLGSFRSEALGILDATHLHFYTRESLHELLASCGMVVESWDCTTNEIAEHVIVDYLRRAGVPYTPELRARFGEPDAMAFQFVIKARPATRSIAVPSPPLEKPLQVMQEIVRDHERLRDECQRLHGEAERLRAEAERDAERMRSDAERLRSDAERLRGDVERLRASPADVEQPRDGGLRVLQVVHQFVPRHSGGTEIYCSDLSFALARRGHAVRVLSGAPFSEDMGTRVLWEGDAAIVLQRLPATRVYRRFGTMGGFFDRFDNPEARLGIREVLDRTRPDVVHVQHLLHLSAELIPECRARGIPVVVTLHDYWFLCHRIKLIRRNGALCHGPDRGWNCCQCLNAPRLVRSHLNPGAVAANMYRYAYLTRQLLKADRILTPSCFLRDVFGRNGVPAERITVCRLGVPEVPRDVADRLAAARPVERVRFGFLGVFTQEKGVHVLVDAFSRLLPGCAELHVFGVPSQPRYEEDVRRAARHPDIRWRGTIPHAERWQALAEMDVLVLPSLWYENSPLAILEARKVGVPVIASAIGGVPEFVENGVNGLTFPAGDVDALARCLRAVVEDPASIVRWRSAIVPPKPMEAHVDEIEMLYHELCPASRETGARPGP
jgi:glycosyltransferase involved in cell wall biosynthesis/SAM-dependent methyltransferase